MEQISRTVATARQRHIICLQPVASARDPETVGLVRCPVRMVENKKEHIDSHPRAPPIRGASITADIAVPLYPERKHVRNDSWVEHIGRYCTPSHES